MSRILEGLVAFGGLVEPWEGIGCRVPAAVLPEANDTGNNPTGGEFS